MSRQTENVTATVTDGVLASVTKTGSFVSEADFGDGNGLVEVRLPINTSLYGPTDLSDSTRLAFDSFVSALDADLASKKTREIEELQRQAEALQKVADEAQANLEPVDTQAPTNP